LEHTITEFGGYFAADTSPYNGDPTIVTVSFYGQSATPLDTENLLPRAFSI